MKNKILIIDGNNLLHRAYYKFSNLRTSKGVLSGVIYGFPYVLSSLIKTHLPDDVIVVFDGGRDKKRLEILPEYKGNRTLKVNFDPDDFNRQKEVVKEMLSILGIKVITQKKKEADDIIWLLARKLKRKNQVMIVSSDKDFTQLISKNLTVWNPKNNKRYTSKNVFEDYGFYPEQCVDYLIMDGDKSDNIPGLTGVGEVSAKWFLKEFGSIENYLTSNVEEHKKFPRNRLEEVFLRNRKLIDIRRFVRNYMSLKDVEYLKPKSNKKVKFNKFALLCSKYEISSFTEPNFIRTFNILLTKNKNNTLCQRYF